MNRRKTPFVLQQHALPQMAMFAEAVEWATSQTQIETQPPGHIAIDPRQRGGRYAVWIRYGTNGKQIKDYLGPEG